MKCESFRNRLLALPSPAAPTPELAAHLDTCAGCRAFAERAGTLDALLAGLPVPSAEAARIAFVESLAALGPVIQTRPTVPSSDPHSGTFRPFRALAGQVNWRYAASLAAAVLLAVTAWLAWPAGKPPVVEADGPRQELLAKQGKHLAALASATAADARLRVWADWATDLRKATTASHAAATAPDMKGLEVMFKKAIRDGVLKQADQLPRHLPAAERVAVLRDAQAKMADARAELERNQATAPPQCKPNLELMAKHALEAQEKLADLAKGGGT
jgi:hypothetical protein